MKVKNPRIIKAVKELELPIGEYAVFGSGLLEVLGIRKGNDIDLIVTKELFENMGEKWEKYIYENNGDEAMKYKGEGFDVAFYYCHRCKMDEAEVKNFIKRATIIDGVAFVNLEDTMTWKRRWGREKDLKDTELIKEYLGGKMASQQYANLKLCQSRR